MTRRRCLALGLALGVVLLGTVIFQLARPRSPVNRVNLAKLHEGQTEHEVEENLGGPGGELALPLEGSFQRSPGEYFKQWTGDEEAILVTFTPDGKMACAGFYVLNRPPESPLDRLRRWLRL